MAPSIHLSIEDQAMSASRLMLVLEGVRQAVGNKLNQKCIDATMVERMQSVCELRASGAQ